MRFICNTPNTHSNAGEILHARARSGTPSTAVVTLAEAVHNTRPTALSPAGCLNQTVYPKAAVQHAGSLFRHVPVCIWAFHGLHWPDMHAAARQGGDALWTPPRSAPVERGAEPTKRAGLSLRFNSARPSYPTDHEPWRARSAPHIIISSSRVDVLQMRSTRDSLRFVDRGASLRRSGGDTATSAGRVPDH